LALGAGIATFLAVVLTITLYFYAIGDAGKQRGFIIRNTLPDDLQVTIAGQTATVGPAKREHTFVLDRADFPSIVRAAYVDGRVLVEREIAYEEITEADYRMSIDAKGIYPTGLLRERATPAATP
jgi:hypothetical protein